jgi:hypothetical protein
MGLITPNMNRMNLFPVFFTPRKDPEAMVYSGMTRDDVPHIWDHSLWGC